jgi:hypothetical protein
VRDVCQGLVPPRKPDGQLTNSEVSDRSSRGAFPAQVDVDLDSTGPGGPETIETAIALTPVTWPNTINAVIWLSVDAR